MISARWRLLFGPVLAIGLLSPAAQSAEAPHEQAYDSPKVEFGEVQGFTCLQPVVKLPGAELKDFQAAERRWRSKVYPDSSAEPGEVVLSMPADTPETDEAEDVTVVRETYYVQKANGSSVEVCFDIGVKERERDPRE